MNRFKPQRRAVLAFIASRKVAPTLMEIADGCKFESSNAARYHVEALIKLELLTKVPGQARGLFLTNAGAAALERHALCACDVPCQRFTCESSLHRGSRSTPWCNGGDDEDRCATCAECWVKRERLAS